MIKKLLELAGVLPERFRLEWCSSAEAQRFVEVVSGMIETVKGLGPLGSNGVSGEKLQERLSAARDAAGSDRLRWVLGCEYKLETSPNAFGQETSEETFKEMLDTAVKDEYLKARILNMTRAQALSVKEMAAKIELDPADVLRIVTIMRGRNVIDVKEVRDTSPLYTALV